MRRRSAAALLQLAVLLLQDRRGHASCPEDADECATANRGVDRSGASLQYSVFMGMQYYGPPEPLST